MPRWTDEQLQAINTSGKNIIVSAGAGSGKTAVLTERVITKLKQGIKINELLILTFTNAAASEMKDRIRTAISENPDLKENLDIIDASYITTFDSYTLSLVKKYSYLLNISPKLSIIDNSTISIIKNKMLEEVFSEFYEKNEELFRAFIKNSNLKNDTELKKSILKIYESLENKINKEEILDNYFQIMLSDEKRKEYIKEYEDLILMEVKKIETNIFYLSESDFSDYYTEMEKALEKLLKSKNYDEVKENINVSLPRRPKNSEDIKIYKDNISDSLDTIKGYLKYNNVLEIEESFKKTFGIISVIIDIIKELDKKIKDYKYKLDLYEFIDIELMAIKLLKENEEIRKELQQTYKEICVDEYQDTNDIQEEFISLIENNNCYMVGDIKQSIYGFRNANPSIFKNKYDLYSQENGGVKIDLLKNFRSRSNVLGAINEIFGKVMDLDFGGANYVLEHQMVFGNLMYEEEIKNDQNYDLEVYNYERVDNTFSKEEIESFIIANDIKNKIKDGYQVIDKKTKKLRNCSFEDFCIIMDRGTSFPIIKKILEYLEIPLQIYEDKVLTNEVDFSIITNLIGLIIKINKQEFDKTFKYYFLSVGRSFLSDLNDAELFRYLKNGTYKESDIYNKCYKISEDLNELSSYELIKRILQDFNYYDLSIRKGDIEETIIRINHLLEMANNLGSIGYYPESFLAYLEKMNESKIDVKYKNTNFAKNSVKVMNIHKSKGLEFPICYFCGFHKEFNTREITEKYLFDNKYGLLVPYFEEGINETILKDLVKHKYYLDNISEQIRLFYVALTRTKEKMILVTSLDEEKKYVSKIVDSDIRNKYNSFLKIVNSVSGNLKDYIKNINLEELKISKDYLYSKDDDKDETNSNKEKLEFRKINVLNEEITRKKASKEVNNLLAINDIKLLEYGTKMHSVLENADFKNYNNCEYKELISRLCSKLDIKDTTKIYKEHEFIFNTNNDSYNGIIDLVLEDLDTIKIVDYKLKNIDDEKYISQLNVYYNYIKSVSNKKIKVYLYSILEDRLEEIDTNSFVEF